MDKRKLRTLKNFFYKYRRYGWEDGSRANIRARLLRDIDYLKSQIVSSVYWRKKALVELKDTEVALKYSMELHLSDKELSEMAKEQAAKQYNNWKREGTNTPVIPNRARDSKCHATYEYGVGCSRVRFPSLKRGRSTWKRFYTMFPRIAESDHWNGQTSDRYKGI